MIAITVTWIILSWSTVGSPTIVYIVILILRLLLRRKLRGRRQTSCAQHWKTLTHRSQNTLDLFWCETLVCKCLHEEELLLQSWVEGSWWDYWRNSRIWIWVCLITGKVLSTITQSLRLRCKGGWHIYRLRRWWERDCLIQGWSLLSRIIVRI